MPNQTMQWIAQLFGDGRISRQVVGLEESATQNVVPPAQNQQVPNFRPVRNQQNHQAAVSLAPTRFVIPARDQLVRLKGIPVLYKTR